MWQKTASKLDLGRLRQKPKRHHYPEIKKPIQSVVRKSLSHTAVAKLFSNPSFSGQRFEFTSKGPRKFKGSFQQNSEKIKEKILAKGSLGLKRQKLMSRFQYSKSLHSDHLQRTLSSNNKKKVPKHSLSVEAKKAETNREEVPIKVEEENSEIKMEVDNNDSDTSISDPPKATRFSARQLARRVRRKANAKRNSESDDGCCNGDRALSSSPVGFKSILDAAMERKLNANDISGELCSAPHSSNDDEIVHDALHVNNWQSNFIKEGNANSVDVYKNPGNVTGDTSADWSSSTKCRQRSQSLMELICNETLDDFESPSKEKLRSQKCPLPIIIQNLTKVNSDSGTSDGKSNARYKHSADIVTHVDIVPIDREASDVSKTLSQTHSLPTEETFGSMTTKVCQNSLLELADVVVEQN